MEIDRVFGFLDGSFNRPNPTNLSMTNARRLGWHGYVDSMESFLEVFGDFAKLKMIPAVPFLNLEEESGRRGYEGYGPLVGRVG